MDLTTVHASTTSYKAYWPVNFEKRQFYWEMSYPHGMTDIEICDIIELEKISLFLESTNQKYGKTMRGRRAEEDGQFNHAQKMIFLAAISGDDEDPMKWHECWVGEGTTLERFLDFMLRILDVLDTRYPGRSFCFTMDNLNVHHNPAVVYEIYYRGRHLFC